MLQYALVTVIAHTEVGGDVTACDQGLSESIERYLRQKFQGYLAELREWVNTNSYSLNRNGVNTVASMTASYFTQLGFEAEVVPTAVQGRGDHLALKCLRSEPSVEIALISHLDTVFPAEEEEKENFHWLEEGDRIYGPGTMDIKGGTMCAFMALDALAAHSPHLFEKVNWLFLLNAQEELLMSDDFQVVIDRFIVPGRTDVCLAYECGGIVGETGSSIVTARKGMAFLDIEVSGRSSHSGVFHEKGANALRQLAHIIEKLESLTDHSRGFTVNVGVAQGGVTRNRVPHKAWCHAEMRARDRSEYEEGIEIVKKLEQEIVVKSIADGFPCTVHIRPWGMVPPWKPTPETYKLLSYWQKAGNSMNYKIEEEFRGGLADINRIPLGIPALDGLGPLGENEHCSERSKDGTKIQEFIYRDSLLRKAKVTALALSSYIEDGVKTFNSNGTI
jgi:glutamate carboxypeptidase